MLNAMHEELKQAPQALAPVSPAVDSRQDVQVEASDLECNKALSANSSPVRSLWSHPVTAMLC